MKKTKDESHMLDGFPDPPQTDWKKIRGIFRYESDYLVNLVRDIVEDIEVKGTSLKNDFPRNLQVDLGQEADEFNADYILPLRHIKEAFLKFLEYRGIIRNLVIKDESSVVDEIDGSLYNYTVADFVVDQPREFSLEATGLIHTFTENGNEERTFKEITFEDKHLCWNKTRIPFERGYSSLISEFLKTPAIYRSGKQIKAGEPIHRKILEEAGPYKDEMALRNALKVIRSKLAGCGYPVRIENTKTNHYLMVIRYLN